jgi:hypothetical protein
MAGRVSKFYWSSMESVSPVNENRVYVGDAELRDMPFA